MCKILSWIRASMVFIWERCLAKENWFCSMFAHSRLAAFAAIVIEVDKAEHVKYISRKKWLGTSVSQNCKTNGQTKLHPVKIYYGFVFGFFKQTLGWNKRNGSRVPSSRAEGCLLPSPLGNYKRHSWGSEDPLIMWNVPLGKVAEICTTLCKLFTQETQTINTAFIWCSENK